MPWNVSFGRGKNEMVGRPQEVIEEAAIAEEDKMTLLGVQRGPGAPKAEPEMVEVVEVVEVLPVTEEAIPVDWPAWDRKQMVAERR